MAGHLRVFSSRIRLFCAYLTVWKYDRKILHHLKRRVRCKSRVMEELRAMCRLIFIPTYFAGTRKDKKCRVHDLGKFRPCTRLSYEDLRLLSTYVLQLPHHLHHLLT